jgi:hypothetical protein
MITHELINFGLNDMYKYYNNLSVAHMEKI